MELIKRGGKLVFVVNIFMLQRHHISIWFLQQPLR